MTCDVSINGEKVANDVNSYTTKHPRATTYEISDCKGKNGYQFLYAENSAGTILEDVKVKVYFYKVESIENMLGALASSIDFTNTHKFMMTASLDGRDKPSMGIYGTCDVLIGGTKIADDVNSFYGQFPNGLSYEINDCKGTYGYNFAGTTNPRGKIDKDTTVKINLVNPSNFGPLGTVVNSTTGYYLKITGNIDGKESSNLGTYGTCDISINGTKVADDVNEFSKQYADGTTYEISDCKGKNGYKHAGTINSKGTLNKDVTAKISFINPSHFSSLGTVVNN